VIGGSWSGSEYVASSTTLAHPLGNATLKASKTIWFSARPPASPRRSLRSRLIVVNVARRYQPLPAHGATIGRVVSLVWRVLVVALALVAVACAEGSGRPDSDEDDDDGGAGGAGGAGGMGGGMGGGTGGSAGGGGEGGKPPCMGTFSAQFIWGSIPAPMVTTSGNTWSIGDATAAVGPPGGAGSTYLATVPGGTYPPGRDDWVMLPTMDLSAVAGCTVLVNVDLWRETETGIDGGNLQVTDWDPPTGSSIWTVVGGYPGTMEYDATGLSGCGPGCIVEGQPVWTGSAGVSKKPAANLSDWAGKPAVTLRFAFHSDAQNELDGVYVGTVLVTTD
jgi:hypothetical protein